MPPFFPTPHPDELLYSVIARYHLQSGNLSWRRTLMDLFGSNSACAVVDLPCRLQSFVDNLLPWTALSPEVLIRDHTMFPLYRLFLSQERAKVVVERMSDPRQRGRVHTTIGQMASRIPTHPVLKYCQRCLQDDIIEFAESYWHRCHQAYGVRLCHRHGEPLIDSHVKIGSRDNKHAFIALTPDPVPNIPPAPVRNPEFHLWLANSIYQLLNNSHEHLPLDLDILLYRYRFHLEQLGIGSTKGNIRTRILLEEMTQYYPSSFLEEIACSLEGVGPDNWLFKLVRKPRTVSHPLHHLLLIKFLGCDIWEFLEEKLPYTSPFGRSPWPCLNRAAEHYRQAVIGTCDITYSPKAGTITGIFQCRCGFTYARHGPDRCREDRLRYHRIVAFGNVWEEKLRLLKLEGLGLRELGRRLGVTANTIKKHLAHQNTPPLGSVGQTNGYSQRDQRRMRWLKLCRDMPDQGVKVLRQQAPADYVWLYRHDREWLKKHSPPRKAPRLSSPRCDWPSRDRELSTKIPTAVIEIMRRRNPAIRVSISAIGKAIGHVDLLTRRLDKLPLTATALANVVETREAFAERRLRAAQKRFLGRGEKPPKWQLLRDAGIRKELADKLTLDDGQ